ncbi:MAG: metal ABC transporter ATP-binding protein [Deltaproteobacteria bacterium]|nr:metal ABC transporter ATP-binding protein [Deltaproteobacteria bacterium]
MADTPLIRCTKIAIGYSGRVLLDGIDFSLARGEFVGLVGPNGGGKTTLLRTVLGLIPPVRGEVVRAPSPSGGALRFGYVIQREHLDRVFPLSLREVVLMGRTARIGLLRFPGREDRRKVAEALERVGIADLADRPFRDLSGGQQQRAIIARALAEEPDVMVLDEPTTGTDVAGEGAVMDLLADLNRGGMTMLMVSHALSTVMNHAARLAFIRHDRKLFRMGPTREMLTREVLTELYEVPVQVDSIGGHLVVLREADANRPSAGAEDA